MAGQINRLSKTQINAAKVRARLADGGGLLLNVSHSGRRIWIFRWVRHKKASELGLDKPIDAVSRFVN